MLIVFVQVWLHWGICLSLVTLKVFVFMIYETFGEGGFACKVFVGRTLIDKQEYCLME